SLVKYSQKATHACARDARDNMEQLASLISHAGHAIRLNCGSLGYGDLPLQLGGYQIILCNTIVAHTLATTEYKQRRKECKLVLSAVQNLYSGVNSLRDVTFEMLNAVTTDLSPKVWDRCTYVLEENERLMKGCQMLEAGDLAG